MARHSKKNLKKRGKRISFKQKHPLRSVSKYNPIQTEWSGRRTIHANYRRLGLISNANAIPVTIGDNKTVQITLTELTTKKETVARENITGKKTFAQEFDDHDSERALTGFRLTADRRLPFWMSDEDVRYLQPLVKRYGRDYASMFRDHKLNPLQKTKAWLKKKCVRLEKFNETKSNLVKS